MEDRLESRRLRLGHQGASFERPCHFTALKEVQILEVYHACHLEFWALFLYFKSFWALLLFLQTT